MLEKAKLMILRPHVSFDDFEATVVRTTAPGAHTPESQSTFKIRVEKRMA